MRVAFHENNGNHENDENDKDNLDSYNKELSAGLVEIQGRANHEVHTRGVMQPHATLRRVLRRFFKGCAS